MWEQLGDHMPYADLQLNLERARKWHPLNRSLYLGARVMLPGLLLASKGDRVAMNSSVETRYPFLDEEVFAFLAKLHPGWKMRGLRDKLILRYLADRWVPRSIAWRRKAMFRAPLDGFHTTTCRPSSINCSARNRCGKTGYFDPPSVAALAAARFAPCAQAATSAPWSRWAWSASSRRSSGITPSSTAGWRICPRGRRRRSGADIRSSKQTRAPARWFPVA